MWVHNDFTSSARRGNTKSHELVLVARRIGTPYLPYWCPVYVKLSPFSNVWYKLVGNTICGAMACTIRLYLPSHLSQYYHGYQLERYHSFWCSRATNGESRSRFNFWFIFLRLLGMVCNLLVCLRYLWTLLCLAWSLKAPILCHHSFQFCILLLPTM